jgi:hypothetical protein
LELVRTCAINGAMATTTSPTTPPADPTVPASPPPGWRTSEAWITFLTMVIGAIPSSGLTANSPTIAKVVGLVIAGLSALNYTAQRTALKRSYIAARFGLPAVSSKATVISTILLVLMIVSIAIFQPACKVNCQEAKNATNAQCIVEGAVVDCTGVTSLASTVIVVEPIVERLIASAKQADGSINWSSIEQQIVNLALQYGTCVIAQIWNDLMTTGSGSGSGSAVAASGSGSGSAVVASGSITGSGAGSAAILARPILKPADLAAEFDRIRAKTAPGRKFKISGRTL